MIEKRLISDFKRPKGVEFTIDGIKKNLGIFTAKPYERGFATTIGNSLRRVLLSAIPGYGIIAVKFAKINNEFQNINGVYQDTTQIIANLKFAAVRIKDESVKSRVLHFEIKGKTVFTAGDLAKDETIKIGNPEHIIFTTNKDANFSFDVQIDWGRGYVTSDVFAENIEVDGTIPIDGNFSPVLNVSFKVDKVRIGKKNDYESLTIEILTNGVITPEEALKDAAQILKESYLTFNNVENAVLLTTAVDDGRESSSDDKEKIFSNSIFFLEFTTRTHFFLKLLEIREIGQLVTRTEDELKGRDGCNEKILADINEKLSIHNLSLGMKGINYKQKNMI